VDFARELLILAGLDGAVGLDVGSLPSYSVGIRRARFAASNAMGGRRERRDRLERSGPILNIPNLITLGRVILVPVVFWLLVSGKPQAAFVAFVLAGLSDAIDGYLAKRYGWTTELGAYLDPLADKLLIVSMFVALGVRDALPSWLVIAVVTRDFLIIAGVMLSWLLDHPVRIRPFAVSKANTLVQLLLLATVLADEGFALGLAGPRTVLIWLTAVLTLASLAAYLRAWLRHMSGYELD
jgi:cardiolipin synthase